jgi:hypothetical protein
MAGCYGPIQLLRILTQLHRFAVLDQWFTLPFFMWVFVWGNYLTSGWNYGVLKFWKKLDALLVNLNQVTLNQQILHNLKVT